MGVLKQVWTRDIQENLLEGVEFAARAVNHDGLIENEKVNIPQAGAVPSITKNRGGVDATPTLRTDTVKAYDVDSYTTDPMVVKNADELQTSYNKRMSVLSAHIDALNDRLGREIATAWATPVVGSAIETTGADSDQALSNGATGTRGKLTLLDIRNAAKALDNQNVPMNGRVLLIPADVYYELFDNGDVKDSRIMNKTTLPDGVIDRLFGFDIMIKPSVIRLTGAGAIKGVTTAGAATDLYGCLAYHPSFVARALGSAELFVNDGDAKNYGDVMSAEVMLGASTMYTAGTGVVVIKQSTGV